MKFTFRLETDVAKPLEQVIQLFTDHSLFKKWQPGLLDVEFLESKPKLKYRLTYQIGKRKMKMIETVLSEDLPHTYEVEYVLKGARHEVINTFEKLSEKQTRWVTENEYSFKGLMVPVAWFMKDNFRQQAVIVMKNFKGFVERGKKK